LPSIRELWTPAHNFLALFQSLHLFLFEAFSKCSELRNEIN